MDLDFDLDDDRISSFLLNKLEEIKAKNGKLASTLQDRQQFLRGISQSCNTKMDETDIKISSQVWKKIFHDKYVLGVSIENNGSRCFNNVTVILNWNSRNPLMYKAFLYEENTTTYPKGLTSPTFICNKENCEGITNTLKKSDKVTRSAHLVVVLDIPKFTDELSHNVYGNVVFEQDNKTINLKFPPVEISAFDATTHSLHNYSLANGDTKDILMSISCGEETKLVMVFPEDWLNSFDSTFEILCSLTKVNVSPGCRKLFVAHRLSPQFDESLLIFHASLETSSQTYTFTVYSRNEASLLSLLHHLHQNIPGVVIIPESLYENYILQHPGSISVEKETSELKNCLKREISFVNALLQEPQSSENAVASLDKFSDLELNSNLHYIRLFKAINQSAD